MLRRQLYTIQIQKNRAKLAFWARYTLKDTFTVHFICPCMKRSIERALNGEYSYLSGIIDGYTCDAACGIVNIWADTIGGDLFRVLPLPYNDSPDARRFYRAVIGNLLDDVGSMGADFSEAALSAAIDIRIKILLDG